MKFDDCSGEYFMIPEFIRFCKRHPNFDVLLQSFFDALERHSNAPCMESTEILVANKENLENYMYTKAQSFVSLEYVIFDTEKLVTFALEELGIYRSID